MSRETWNKLVEKYEYRLDTQCVDAEGEVYTLFALVHCSEDFYFGLAAVSTGEVRLVSCACNLERVGFKWE